MIVDTRGRPLKPATESARAVVFESADGDSWTAVKPYNVPHWVKDHNVMADMMEGRVVALEAEGPYYKVERLN